MEEEGGEGETLAQTEHPSAELKSIIKKGREEVLRSL